MLWAHGAPGSRVLARAPVPPHPLDLPAVDADVEHADVMAYEDPPDVVPAPVPAAVVERRPLQGVVVDPEGFPIGDAVVRADFGHVGSSCRYATRVFDGRIATTTDGVGRFSFAAPTASRRAVVNVAARGWVEPDPRVVWLGSGVSIFRVPREYVWMRAFLPPMLRPPDGEDEPEAPADAIAMGLVKGIEGAWPELRIVLQRGATIDGTVQTRRGDAVPGAVVIARWKDDLPGWQATSVHSDAEGRFSVLVPAPALLTAAEAHAAGDGSEVVSDARAWAWPLQPGTSGVRLVLEDLVAVDLLLRGAPAPSDKILIRAKPAGFPGPARWLYGAGSLHTEPVAGALRAYALFPGTCDLEADPDGPDCLPAFARATVPGGLVEITWPQMAVVEGRLVGDDVKGFEIAWTGEGRDPTVPCTVGEDGSFTLLGTGAGTLYARRAGDPRCAFVVTALSSGPLHLDLRRGEAIRGHVEGAPGMNLTALQVRAVAGLLTQEARVQEDGDFEIVGLPPMDFRVELRSGAWLHDARDNISAGVGGIRLRVRLPPTEPSAAGS